MNHTHKITIADHKDLEKHRLITKFLRIFVVPVLNRIPASTLQKVIKKSSQYGGKVITKAGTTHSLEAMYTKHQKPPFYKKDFILENLIANNLEKSLVIIIPRR